MIPYTIQGVILSVSILALYVSNPTFLSNRVIMLIGAYCIIILPYIYQGIRNGMRAVNMPVLLEAAEMLGASRIYAFFRVIVPNIISAIVVSSLLAVGIIFGDYVLVRNLASSAWPNVQIYLYQAMKSDSMKSSAVFVVIMAVTFLIAAIVLYLQSRERKGKKPSCCHVLLTIPKKKMFDCIQENNIYEIIYIYVSLDYLMNLYQQLLRIYFDLLNYMNLLLNSNL